MSIGPIGGLISGLDSQTLIQQLMAIERQPIRMLEARQERVQQQSNIFSTINNRLSALQNAAKDLLAVGAFDQKSSVSSEDGVATAVASASAASGTYQIVVNQLAAAHRAASARHDDIAEALELTGSFEINGIEIEVSEEMSLADIRDAINAADAGVRATIVDNHLVLESEETGEANKMAVADTAGAVLQDLGVIDGTGEFVNELQEAQDAQFTVNGLTVTRSANTFDDVVDGVTFNLHGVGTAAITVSQNVDAVMKRISAFVDAYNNVRSYLASQTAKEAPLQGDSLAIRLHSSLRSQLTDPVDAPFDLNQLAVIGITTDREGRLSIDEDRLRAALEQDGDAVRDLFAARANLDGFDGVAARVEAFVSAYTQSGGILSNRQQMFTRQIESLTVSIEQYEDRLVMRERHLVQQFAAMEQALLQLEGQQVALAGFISQMAGSSSSR